MVRYGREQADRTLTGPRSAYVFTYQLIWNEVWFARELSVPPRLLTYGEDFRFSRNPSEYVYSRLRASGRRP
jgi:hypothetical protein